MWPMGKYETSNPDVANRSVNPSEILGSRVLVEHLSHTFDLVVIQFILRSFKIFPNLRYLFFKTVFPLQL